MKFEEVLQALRDRKKIRRKGWHPYEYLSTKFITHTVETGDLLSDDWEIVKEPKKVKLRDLTEEQFNKWALSNCKKYDDKCNGCPFQKVYCDRNPDIDDWWIKNKDLYSDKFLDQEIEIYE